MRLFLAAIALAVVAFLGACSGQDSSEEPEQAETTEEMTEVTEKTGAKKKASGKQGAGSEAEGVPESPEDEAASEVASPADEDASQSNGEPAPSPPPEAQDAPPRSGYRTPSQKAGVNEAGQDVSNTPVISPEENAARLPCLRAYYESLPPDQAGPESQRVVREANARGVTSFDIVGC